MSELRITLTLEKDGTPMPVSPLIYTVNVAEYSLNDFTQAADNDGGTAFHQIQGTVSPTLQVLFVTGSQAFNLKFNNASYLPISANGLVLIVGGNIAASASTNATINIPGANAASVTALSGGT